MFKGKNFLLTHNNNHTTNNNNQHRPITTTTRTNDEGHMKEKGIFHDFNVFAVLSIITMAVVGLLISVVFKYLTSIVQVLCSGPLHFLCFPFPSLPFPSSFNSQHLPLSSHLLPPVLSAFLVSIISITLGGTFPFPPSLPRLPFLPSSLLLTPLPSPVFEPTEFFVFGSVLIFLGVFLYANPTVCMKLVSYVM